MSNYIAAQIRPLKSFFRLSCSLAHTNALPATLPLRRIRDSKVSAIDFGAMGLSGFYGEAVLSDEERFKVLDAALGNGCTMIDTADVYNDNEELIGKRLKRTGNRDSLHRNQDRILP
ncbi:hypothetical protein D9757_003059 [Collybiopsis confluens]|uniref:NADP-dependent oxidoreductase domain-containing protein n=1 Tax=Collybiopsis confluens TaxID=2823264 RepID=A0A8H5HXG5_9AGAR|nr:hypothetical protein D9757_003059 [Collybiopsis confluens]